MVGIEAAECVNPLSRINALTPLPAFALGQAQNAERSLLVVDDVVDRRPSIVRRKFAEGNGATEVGA